ncbi:MBL fold metallo-hydrolase [Streptomyces sp. NPDC006193]|uniref:MBL fold metallo-hydrolase n=1 Tax=Streptomyces sp. NPDC006193 TaxID=3155717 RepID=UPI0033A598C7
MTPVDAGTLGSGRAIADAVAATGSTPRDVRRTVLSHCHADHAGGAAEAGRAGRCRVAGHHLTPLRTGERPGPPPRSPVCRTARCWTSAAAPGCSTCRAHGRQHRWSCPARAC